ncbi:MAG: tetraacyldisaccharide 4'-kinase [Pseudomonadota bacterium]
MPALRERLEAIWYGGAPPPWPLRVLELVYRGALGLRRWLYGAGILGSARIGVPVLVIGNLTVGGTGKTPLVAALAVELRQRGWHPGIALRGYGGRRRRPGMVEPHADPAAHGDEALLLVRATGVPVATGPRRAAAAALLARRGCDVVLCDDGLQHWALARDLEVLVVDGNRRFGNGHLLPAGPLREPVSRALGVDHIVTNGGAPRAGEVPMRVVGQRALALDGSGRALALDALRGREVHAVAGIGNPDRFFALLQGFGIRVRPHPWPDHYPFEGRELAFDDDLPVLVTEKDAVKCSRFADARTWVVPVEAELPLAFIDRLHEQLHALSRRVA